jgi:hypothetical protein
MLVSQAASFVRPTSMA